MARVRVDPETGCWLFRGALNEAGYGIVGLGGRGAGTDRAHRITFRHFVGDIPAGLFVCHRCDVRACCNPAHLFLGTNAENMADCRAKGRASKPPRNLHLRGEAHYAARLTEDKVRQIRELARSGVQQKRIAEEFGVRSGHVCRIVSRKSWAHV